MDTSANMDTSAGMYKPLSSTAHLVEHEGRCVGALLGSLCGDTLGALASDVCKGTVQTGHLSKAQDSLIRYASDRA